MSVYIEFVVLDNLILTYALASLTYRIVLRRGSFPRAAAASVVGTAVAVCYPFVRGNAALLAIKLGLWAALSLILFAGKGKMLLCSVTFLALTFAFGGVIFALGLAAAGSADAAMRADMARFPVSAVAAGGAIAVAAARRLSVRMHKLRDSAGAVYDFGVAVMGHELRLRGLMDTGNRLYDGKTGLPVIIVSIKSLMGAFTDDQLAAIACGKGESVQRGARYMEFSTAGGKGRVLLLRPDETVLYSPRGANIFNDVMMGVSFSPIRDATDYDAILHPALITTGGKKK